VTVVLFAVGMSFLFGLGGVAFDARGMFARNSPFGCIAATGIVGAALISFLQLPSVQDARLPEPQPRLQIFQQQAEALSIPVKIEDANSTFTVSSALENPNYHADQVYPYLLNNAFVAALDTYVALASKNAVPERMQERWETQALRQIRPLDGEDVIANRNDVPNRYNLSSTQGDAFIDFMLRALE